jgi:hypothetical protein
MAEKLEVEASQNPELHELQQDVSPERVLDALEENQRQVYTR